MEYDRKVNEGTGRTEGAAGSLRKRKNRAILENISANLLIRVATYAFSFITVFFAARVLQPEAYGKISFASSFAGYFIMLAHLGMPIYAMRLCAEKKEDRKALSRAVNELWSIGVILSAVSFLALLAAVMLIPQLEKDRLIILIYGSGILFQLFGFEWLFKGLERFRFLAVCHLGARILSLLCMVLFVHTREHLLTFAILSVVASYGSDVVCFLAAGKHVNLSFRFRFNRCHIKPLLIFFLMSCAVSIYSSLDLTMLGFMKTEAEVGLYSVAAKGKSALTMIGGIVWTSVLPQATRLWKEGKKEAFESLAGKSLTIVSAIQLVVTGICFIFAGEIMAVIGGGSYAEAQNAFRILILSLVPIGVSNILGGQVLIPAGYEIKLLKAELIGAVVNFTANLIMIPVCGIEGAAATTVLSEVIVAVVCLYYARKKLNMDLPAGLTRKIIRKAGKEWNRKYVRLISRIRKDRLPYFCPCCNTYLKRFAKGEYEKHPDRFDPGRYRNTRQDVLCPVCGALPRHRILALWCEAHSEELRGSRILYFAPEIGMALWMRRNRIAFTTADLKAEADLMADIQDTGLHDQSYDVIFCNHVLEHVDDFREALREVYRILRTGGSFLCSFPMDPETELLDEDPCVQTEQGRTESFGQFDHKRVFGMKADCFLVEAGFSVTRICGEDYPDAILPVVGPADYDMNILFCCKKIQDPDQ